MFKSFFGSQSPSSSPPDGRAQTSSASGDELKLPRRMPRPQTPETRKQPAPDRSNDSESTNTSVQSGSSELGEAQEGDEIQGTEQSDLPEDGEHAQAFFSTPETISYDLESDAESEIVDSGVKEAVTHVITTTTTEVKEHQTADVQQPERSTVTKERTVSLQPRRQPSTTFSRTTVGQQRYETQVPAPGGGLQKKVSFYRETSIPTKTETSSSTSMVLESRRILTPQKPMYNSAREHLAQIERLHREERDRIIALMTEEHEEYKRFCQEQFEILITENDGLQREITILRTRTISSGGHPGTTLDDEVQSNITTITTSITTITNTITTVTTQIERWKRTVPNNGRVAISVKELNQLSLDVSNTSSRMAELQQRYAELSGDFSSVRDEKDRAVASLTAEVARYDAQSAELSSVWDQLHSLVEEKERAITSLAAEKDRAIVSLTAKVAQLKDADAAARKDNESLRRDLFALQQRYDAQSNEFTSTRQELQTKVSSIKERDLEVARWKQSDATKEGEIASLRRDNEKVQNELTVSYSKSAELQNRYDMQSKELGSVRNEVQAKKSLLEEKERTIIALTATVDQWERADTTKAEQIAAAQKKLQLALESFSSQTADLQNRHETQSKLVISIQSELQVKVSLLEEKEREVSSLAAVVTQAKHEDNMKVDQLATAQKEIERLRIELSSTSTEYAALQKRYEAVRDELHRIEVLYPEGGDQVPVELSEHAVSQHVTRVLEKKDKQMEELRRELGASTTRNAELKKACEKLSKEVSDVRNELEVKTSQDQGIIAALTTQVEQLKRADTTKEERITTLLEQIEKLKQDSSTSTSQLTELRNRYETQSRELITVRNDLQNSTASNEAKDRTIGTLTAEIDQWRRGDVKKTEEIAAALKQVETLRGELFASVAKTSDLQNRYDAQSREFTSTRVDLQTRDDTISSLTAERDQLKSADAKKAEQIATTIEQVKKLEQKLTASTSQLAELKGRYEAQSRELASLRRELTSSNEEKDRAVATLTAQVEEWKRTVTLKEELIVTIREETEDLRLQYTNSSSQLAQLQQRYDMQSKQILSLQDQVKDKESRAISSLNSQVAEWKRSDAAKAAELTTARTDIEQLRRNLATSSSQIIELQKRDETRSTEFSSQVESWKRSDVTKTEELAAARKDLDQLRHDLSSSSSQIVEYRQRWETQAAQLSSQVEQWKCSDVTKTEELTAARKDLDQLRRNLATSSSHITELRKRDETRSTEFSSQIESWKRSDVTKTEELTAARKDLDQLRRDLSSSSSQIIEYRQRCAAQAAQSAELTSQVEQWKGSDTAKTKELATAREKLGQLQSDLSTSSSRITEFQQRCEAQSRELTSLRVELELAGRNSWPEPLSSASTSQFAELQGRYNVQSTELTSLREQLELSRRTVATLNAQIEQWKREIVSKTQELEELRRRSSQVQQPGTPSSLVSVDSRQFYERMSTEIKDYNAVIKLTAMADQWLRADTKRAKDLALELEKRDKENEELRHHLVTLKEIYIRAPELKQIFQSETIEIQRRTEAQSQELRTQLDSVQRFVTTADIYADEVIVQILRKLNAEVQQNTTFMAECILEDWTAQPAKEQRSAAQRVSESIGQTLVGCLLRKELDDVALYLPIALQAYITHHLCLLISSWTSERGYNDLINKTYEQLQKSEAQTISGRWRSLTRTYISPSSMSVPSNLVSFMVSGLSDVVVAAGCAPSLSAAQSKVSTKFGDKVSSIITIAGQFSKMIGEVVSADFEVLAFSPAVAFDEATMEEDVDDDDKVEDETGQKVLCSTQLGMTKRMQLESGKKNTLTVTKAKVILESFLDG